MTKKVISSGRAIIANATGKLLDFGISEVLKSDTSFAKFLDNQVFWDNREGMELVKWFKEVRKGDNQVISVLALPTREVMDIFHIKYDFLSEPIDLKTNLLQFIVDIKEKKISHARLISFCTMPDTMREKIDRSGYLFLDE